MVVAYRSCPRCRFPLTALDHYCGACGFKASRLCPRCEHEVPNDLSFCNYCGQPLSPVETGEKLPKAEQTRLLYTLELRAFRDKIHELELRLVLIRRRALKRRTFDVAVFVLILVVMAFWGAPFFEAQWNRAFEMSPARILALSFLAAVIVMLAAGYVMQARQAKFQSEIDDLRARIMLARERFDEVKQRYPDWSAQEERQDGGDEKSGAVAQPAPPSNAPRVSS